MKDYVTLGSVLFELNSEKPVPWKEEDHLFRNRAENVSRTVPVNISFVEQFPEHTGRIVADENGTKFYVTDDGWEIRDYRAMYLPGHPHYARSIWNGKTLNVFCREDTAVWDNPNFRIWNVLHLENHLLDADGMVLHCCWLEHKGAAILLTAPSGTGKTTHGKLWVKCMASSIVNGDKALLQCENGIWKVCGYPFHGSASECENKTMPIKAIVILRQGTENRIEELRPMQKVKLLLSETTVNFFNQSRVNAVLDLLLDLLDKTRVVMLHCNMEDDAAYMLRDYLYSEGL